MVCEADGPEGAIAQSIFAPLGNDLHGQAALKDGQPLFVQFMLVQGCQLCTDQGLPKGKVFFLVHGAVKIVGAPFSVAGSPKAQIIADALAQNDGRRGIVEIEVLGLSQPLQDAAQTRTGKGAAGNDHDALGNLPAFLPHNLNQRLSLQEAGYFRGKELPVHGQSTARGNPGFGSGIHDHGTHELKLALEQPTPGGFQIGP